MPIADLQIRMRELGRIRTGMTVAARGGKTRPEKLETFRLTSASRELIEHAAAVYGGVVTAWENEWEVVTTSATLGIMVPPGQSLSQWYELWSAGGCQRRCDGRVMVLTDEPCLCPDDPDERRAQANANPPTACKPTTRLNVILPDVPDLGVWRLESHGYYAATELAGAAEILAFAAAHGRPIPARLRLDRRDKKVPGQPTKVWMVPVIEFVDTRIADLIGPGDAIAPRQLSAGAGTRHEGPEPDLPETSDFRAPVPDGPPASEPDTADEIPGDRPPESASKATESEEAPSPVAEVPLGEPPAEAEAPPDPPPAAPGLTQRELIDRLNAAHVTTAQAVEWANRIFPERPDDQPLTPQQRLALWEEIEAGLAAGL